MNRVPLLPDRPRPLLFAHRGCSSLAPENTMASYRKARELGSPGIELDVHYCEGRLVVAHDDTFVRTAPPDANGRGLPIGELTLREVRAIDVGSFFGPGFSGERPPLLEEVLEEFCPALYVDIELKTRKAKDDPLPGLVAAKLKAMGKDTEQAVTISSFNPLSLAAFKQAAPHIPTAVIYCADAEVPWFLRHGLGRFIAACDYAKPIHLQMNSRSRLCIAALEKRPLIPWTIDDPALAERMLRLGAEGIITNCPQTFCTPGSGFIRH